MAVATLTALHSQGRTYVYVCTYVCFYVSKMNIYVQLLHAGMFISICVCEYLCICVNGCMCVVRKYVCMLIYIYIYIYSVKYDL
jgi:hypothetical protein